MAAARDHIGAVTVKGRLKKLEDWIEDSEGGFTEQEQKLEKLERGLNDLQQWGSGAQVQISSLERKVDEGLSAVNQRVELLEAAARRRD